MNHIHRLQKEIRARKAERAALVDGLNDLVIYLCSEKFACGNDPDGYVQINDVIRRIQEAKSAGETAFDQYGLFTS
jgi:hypothetical protein